jgi:predicted aminopeptidase
MNESEIVAAIKKAALARVERERKDEEARVVAAAKHNEEVAQRRAARFERTALAATLESTAASPKSTRTKAEKRAAATACMRRLREKHKATQQRQASYRAWVAQGCPL